MTIQMGRSSRRAAALVTLSAAALSLRIADACNTGQWYDAMSTDNIAAPVCKTQGGEIFVIEITTTFTMAKSSCAEKEATLVTIQSAQENQLVSSTCGSRACWIGLSEATMGAQRQEEWKWIDGTALSYSNWADGEPNNHEGRDEDAAFMNLCMGRIEDLVGFLFLMFICCGLPLIALCGEGIAFLYAVQARNEMLPKAKAGQRVEPPSPFWRYCCGSGAIYYWEGCSVNYFIVYCLWPCFGICCWNPTPQPMDNGMLVGAPIATGGYGGYGGVVVGKIAGGQ